jgi:hypothetical protein
MLVEHRKRRRRRRDRGTTARLDTLRDTTWREGLLGAAHEVRDVLRAIMGWKRTPAEGREALAGRREDQSGGAAGGGGAAGEAQGGVA